MEYKDWRGSTETKGKNKLFQCVLFLSKGKIPSCCRLRYNQNLGHTKRNPNPNHPSSVWSPLPYFFRRAHTRSDYRRQSCIFGYQHWSNLKNFWYWYTNSRTLGYKTTWNNLIPSYTYFKKRNESKTINKCQKYSISFSISDMSEIN